MVFPIEYISLLNIAVIVLIILCALSGYKNGFFIKVINCFTIVVVAILSWFISTLVSSSIDLLPKKFTPMLGTIVEPFLYDKLNEIFIFSIIFIVIIVAATLLKKVFKLIDYIPVINGVNKVVGLLFGFVEGILYLCIIAFIFATPLISNGDLVIEQSVLKPAYHASEKLLIFVLEDLEDLRSIQKIGIPSSELTEKDLKNIEEWLKENSVDEKEIKLFIESLKY